MTTYRITSPYFVAAVIVSSDLVMQSGPILGWSVGHDFDILRQYVKDQGWKIEPLDESQYHTTWIDTEEASYELKWVGKTCLRITRHVEGYEPEDVTAGELPDEVIEMIE